MLTLVYPVNAQMTKPSVFTFVYTRKNQISKRGFYTVRCKIVRVNVYRDRWHVQVNAMSFCPREQTRLDTFVAICMFAFGPGTPMTVRNPFGSVKNNVRSVDATRHAGAASTVTLTRQTNGNRPIPDAY